jgi:hypothetical protein
VVIGDAFAWAHLPKTGGDTTSAMLRAVSGLVRSADPADSPRKHDTFWMREDDVRDKLLVMNMRRLPAWLLSAAHHRARHGVEPDYRPEPVPPADELVRTKDPDDMLRWMTDADRLPVRRWLRTEHLLEDMLALLDELGELTPHARRRVTGVGPRNQGSYDRRVEHWFTRQQLATLYERNPAWTRVERELYGGVIEPSV